MSLYYDAALVLSSPDQSGSLKSRVYSKDANLKSKPAHLYALISETAKYDTFLKEVIDHAGILSLEPKLTPLLSLLLAHDHFFAKRGIAAAANHPLKQSIDRHKARLQSEFTKARLRRKIPSVEQLKLHLLLEKGRSERVQPRWARINTLKTTAGDNGLAALQGYEEVQSLDEIVNPGISSKVLHKDKNIPYVLAFPPLEEWTKKQAYLNGELILQDKASCFPAYLLLGDQSVHDVNDAMDGCAAPGNKTTHMAAIMSDNAIRGRVFACERDAIRSKTLQTMVSKAGADKIATVLQKQDFLALDPNDERFQNVTHLLLDPSCSGSGIMRREDIPKLALPTDPRKDRQDDHKKSQATTKKRKRDAPQVPIKEIAEPVETDPESEAQPIQVDTVRLQKLSNLQSLIVEHAFAFPAAKRVTYSTCSTHLQENEIVVERVLKSGVARNRGWRILKRDEQVEGLRLWKHRGIGGQVDGLSGPGAGHGLTEEQIQACIRCSPDDGEGTMGFFVCGFTRDASGEHSGGPVDQRVDEDDDWGGFSDG